MVFAALLEYATVGYMGKRIAMRKTRTQQIVRLLNEHREKCFAAHVAQESALSAAAEYGTNGNGGNSQKDRQESSGVLHRNHSASGSHHGGGSSLMRTASLYQQGDEPPPHLLHKRVS